MSVFVERSGRLKTGYFLTHSNSTVSKTCPQCGSSKLRRSHSRGLVEHLLKYFRQRAYRCKDCGWRGRSNAKSRKKRQILSKGYTIGRLVFIAVVLLVAIFILIYLVERVNEDSGNQTNQPTASNSHASRG